MKIICPKCKGSKYVLDKAAVIFTAGIVPMFDWILGGPDKDKISKERCPKCEGRGSIHI